MSWILPMALLGMSLSLIRAETAMAEEPPLEHYEARITDKTLTKESVIGGNHWKCDAGVCSALGRGSRASVKGCVRFSLNLGVEVTHYQFGANALSAEELASCQSYARAHMDQRPRELTSPTSNEQSYDLSSEVGQVLAGDGSVRMMFRSGGALLLMRDGKLFEFDEDRRVVRRGRFARWESQRGGIGGTEPISDAVRDRCAHDTLTRVLRPGDMDTNSFTVALCFPQNGVVRLFYTPVGGFTAADDARASKLAFASPYREPEAAAPAYSIRVSELQRRARVRVGSIGVSRPFENETNVAITAVSDAVLGCYRWALGRFKPFEGQGELLLSLGPHGKQRTALVLRSTYANAPRFNACVEQTLFAAELPDLGEPIRLSVPFDVLLALPSPRP